MMPVDLNKLLEQSRKIHFVGVGGSGMYPLVQILLAAGHRLSGSDVNEGEILDYERRAGVRVMMGQAARNVHGAELVVYSAAIQPDNPERLEAERLGIPCVERSVMLGYVAALYRRPLCIAGTHGKTTATGMAVQILEMGGFDPGAVIGGRLPLIGGYGKAGGGPRFGPGAGAGSANPPPVSGGARQGEQERSAVEGGPRFGPSAGAGSANPPPVSGARQGEQERPAAGIGDGIVVEACEYHNTFLELRPECAVLLNVDADHLEFFGSMENLKEAFRKFCRLATGAVLYNGDDENTLEVVAPILEAGVNAEGRPLECLSFGLSEGCDFRAVNLREHRPGFWAFTLFMGGEAHGEIALGAPGRHNVYNALAAAGGAMRLGASFGDIAKGLAAFGGTGRRFEVLGETGGVTIADDYAHHPAEIKAALTAAKAMEYGRVWAVHQPYTYSRTQMLLDDFAKVLPIADKVVLTAIMGGRERREDYTVTTKDLADKIPGSVWFETQREAADYVLQNAQPGDLVLTLGCGDIYKCAHMMLGDRTWG